MRITIFTSNQARHNHLIRLLAREHEVYAVQECNTVFPGEVDDFYRKSPVMQEYFGKMLEAERKVFGLPRFDRVLDKRVTRLPVKMGDLNMLTSEHLAQALRSDIYVVFGASYIKGWLIDHLVKNNAYNIHMGISPQYRGSSTNFWAMYHKRYDMVGATIHKLTKELDSGPIYFTSRPKIAYDAFEFGMRAVEEAHLAFEDALGDLAYWEPCKQDRSLELSYTKNKDFTDEVAQEYLDNLPTIEAIGEGMRK